MRALQFVVVVIFLLVGAALATTGLSRVKDGRMDPNWPEVALAGLLFGLALLTAYTMRGTRKF